MIRKNKTIVNEVFICYDGKVMEVALLDQNTLKIKGKKGSLVVDPRTKMPKTSADAVLTLDSDSDFSKVEEYRVVVGDDGEYEVGGIKITGLSSGSSGVFYNLNVDNSQTFLAKASTLSKLSDTSNEAQVAILNVDSLLNEALVASLEAKVVILYGEKASEGLTALGKKDLSPTKKYATPKDLSLESETQIVWLA